MTDYIELSAAIEATKHAWAKGLEPSQYIEALPVADVAPVVHGRWIGAPLCGNDNCRCSECGSWHNVHANLCGEIIQKYCPNCGAKMDLEETDNG